MGTPNIGAHLAQLPGPLTPHPHSQSSIYQGRQRNDFLPARLEKISQTAPFPWHSGQKGLTIIMCLFNFLVAYSLYFHLQTVEVQE